MTTYASDYYRANSSTCSALLGRYLFEESRLSEADFSTKETLYLCTGDRQWTAVCGGMDGMLDEVRREVDRNDQDGLGSSDLAEDWGVIANDAGQIIARAHTNGGVCRLRFLGVEGGALESVPVTVQRVGIAWEPRASADALRHRG